MEKVSLAAAAASLLALPALPVSSFCCRVSVCCAAWTASLLCAALCKCGSSGCAGLVRLFLRSGLAMWGESFICSLFAEWRASTLHSRPTPMLVAFVVVFTLRPREPPCFSSITKTSSNIFLGLVGLGEAGDVVGDGSNNTHVSALLAHEAFSGSDAATGLATRRFFTGVGFDDCERDWYCFTLALHRVVNLTRADNAPS